MTLLQLQSAGLHGHYGPVRERADGTRALLIQCCGKGPGVDGRITSTVPSAPASSGATRNRANVSMDGTAGRQGGLEEHARGRSEVDAAEMGSTGHRQPWSTQTGERQPGGR